MMLGATCGRDGGHDLMWGYSADCFSYGLFSSMDFGPYLAPLVYRITAYAPPSLVTSCLVQSEFEFVI